MREVNAWIERHTLRDGNVAFVDTRQAVAHRHNLDLLADSPDELHPSADGYRRMGEAILPVLERILTYPT
jgi:lysophospholipase L1-like esterase